MKCRRQTEEEEEEEEEKENNRRRRMREEKKKEEGCYLHDVLFQTTTTVYTQPCDMAPISVLFPCVRY